MSEQRTVNFKVTIEYLLSLPNLMNYVTTNEGVTEDQVRDQLQKWKDEGHEYIPE